MCIDCVFITNYVLQLHFILRSDEETALIFFSNMLIIYITISIVFRVKIEKMFLNSSAKRQIRGVWWPEK